MKAIHISFMQMLRQMKRDVMLISIAFVPFIVGVVFRFAIPIIEDLLTGCLSINEILAPYYELFDFFLVIITPSMFNYIVAMVILEEADDHMIAYLAVTPLGKAGYLLSRLGITGLISFPVSIFVALIFHLSNTDMLMLTGIALAGTIQGVVAALLIVALSANKVEGMAVGKIASLFSIGAIVPYFVTGKAQYVASLLPSFWMAKAMQRNGYFSLVIAIFLAIIWSILLSEKFMKKIAN